MEFTSDFVQEFGEQQDQIQSLFTDTPEKTGLDVGEKVQDHWHTPPEIDLDESVSKFAVDGSRATRQFSNGSELLVSQALMIGGDGQENHEFKKMFVDAYRGPANPDLTRRYSRLVSHLTEIEVILESWDEIPKGSVIYIDGSIHGRYLHSLWPFNLQGRQDVPLQLLKRHMDLIEHANEKDITLIGVSKTSQIRALAGEFGEDIPDTELLYKHTSSPGVSTPVVLGGYGFKTDEFDWLNHDPERFADRIFTQSISKDKAVQTIRRLRDSPAVASFHIRMERNQETMRIDVPVNTIGIDDKISSFKSRMIETGRIGNAYGHVAEDYGGVKVYNNLLYTVDKLVRLNQNTVDNVYLKIIQEELDTDIKLTRSYRRFM
jgi:hypothetical protein